MRPGTDDDPKPRTRIQRRNEARILDAALEVFSAHGFHGATIDRIASGAGMSKPNVLYYFRTKRDIHAAVLQRTLGIWLEPLERLDPDGDPIEEIWRYAAVKLRLSREAPLASRLFANEVLQGAQTIQSFLDTELVELVARKCAVLQAWIDDGRLAPVEPLHLLFLIWSFTQHYADFDPQVRALHGDGDDALYDGAERTLRLLLARGLEPPDNDGVTEGTASGDTAATAEATEAPADDGTGGGTDTEALVDRSGAGA